MTCVVVWNVVELGVLVFPVEIWRTAAEAVFHLQRLVVLYVVHQIEVAHLVIVGGTVSGEKKLFRFTIQRNRRVVAEMLISR